MSAADTIKAVTVPFTARAEIGGASYPLTRFEVTYMTNMLSQASADFAIGTRSDGGQGAHQVEFIRGTPASLWMDIEAAVADPVRGTILLPAGSHKVFDGVIDDTGPSNLQKGAFNLQAKLVSSLAKLDTGALQMSRLVPRSVFDTSVPIGNALRENVISAQYPRFVGDNLKTDFWDELRRVLLSIAASSIEGAAQPRALREYIEAVGTGTEANGQATNMLGLIQGALTPNEVWADPEFNKNLATYLTYLFFDNNFRMESFLARVVSLGQEFKFRVVESPLGVAIAPYSPFFPSGDAKILYPSSIIAVQWESQRPESCGGGVMTAAGAGRAQKSDGQRYIVGSHVRPGFEKNPLGVILPLPAPEWMARLRNDLGQAGGELPASGKLGSSYCKELVLENAYSGRTVQVLCPPRLDIGCLTPVKIQYPTIPGVNDGGGDNTAVYGSVQMVKLTADAVKKSAETTFVVGYVRSATQQKAEFEDYAHPIWSQRYVGAALTEHPDAGRQ